MQPLAKMALVLAPVALLFAATPALCGLSQAAAPQISADAGPPAPAVDGAPQAAAAPASAASRVRSAAGVVKAALHELSPRKMLGDRLFAKAERQFPAFCNDWAAKLKDRERNNIAHLNWTGSNGLETGTYVGYGSIQSCTCKQSSKGIPVGKLYYQEFEYRLEGKTLDDARHATPKPATITNTTEIFRWDKKQDKWIY